MPHSLAIDAVDLLLIVPEHEWDGEGLTHPSSEIYEILAEGVADSTVLARCDPGPAVRFTLKHTKLLTVAARVPVGLVETALVTRELLEVLEPSIVALVGFGGILSDDLRLGDVAVASQVDCYLTKNKAASSSGQANEGRLGTEIAFAGEVFRPSHSLVQLAMNLKYAHPTIYAEFQAEVRKSLRRPSAFQDSAHEVRQYLRTGDFEMNDGDVSLVQIAHFASAEVISTTTEAVKWLLSRDRKLAIVDMESGGVLAAAWETATVTGDR